MKQFNKGEKFVEEVDIGWDLEARRDDAKSLARMRDDKKRVEKSTQITLNDRKTSVSYAKFLVKKLLSDNEYINDAAKDLLNKLNSAKDGDEFDVHEIESYLHQNFVTRYAEVVKESRLPHKWDMESFNMKNKWKKIMKESEDKEVTPKVYVSTYAKYNDGSLGGEWVDLTDFDTYEDFVDYCSELHKDENDPEFMVQDYEGYPSSWYHESGLPTEDEFNKIREFSELYEDEKKAYAAFCELGLSNDSVDNFRDHYFGEYTNDYDLGVEFVERFGMPENAESYFDYETFGSVLMYDYHNGDPDNTDSEGNPEDPDHYYDQDGYDLGEYHSNEQVAMDFIDSLGSIKELGNDGLSRYFDYEAYGRDVRINDLEESDGYLFWNG